MRARPFVSGLLLLATLVTASLLVEEGLFGELLSKEWIDHEVRDHGVYGELVFVGVAGVATALALPRHLVSFLGGYAFGFGPGTLLALAGTELGCLLSFYYARTIGRPLVAGRFGERMERVERFLGANPFAMTLLIRLLPIGNNFATCVTAGLARVPAGAFLLGSLVGYVPQTVVFALAGSGVDIGESMRVVLAVALFLVSGAIGARLYRRYRAGNDPSREVGEALEERG